LQEARICAIIVVDEMKVFVGNLSGETTEEDLRQAFESCGQVRSITIVRDETSGESRGFAFVIMPLANEATNAIEKMNGKDLRGQKIKVEKGGRTKAKARSSRRKRSGSGTRGRADGGRGGDPGGRRGRRRH